MNDREQPDSTWCDKCRAVVYVDAAGQCIPCGGEMRVAWCVKCDGPGSADRSGCVQCRSKL